MALAASAAVGETHFRWLFSRTIFPIVIVAALAEAHVSVCALARIVIRARGGVFVTGESADRLEAWQP